MLTRPKGTIVRLAGALSAVENENMYGWTLTYPRAFPEQTGEAAEY